MIRLLSPRWSAGLTNLAGAFLLATTSTSLQAASPPPDSGALIYLDDFSGDHTRARFVMEAELYSGRIVGANGDNWWEVNGANQLFLEGPNAGQTAPSAFPGARDNYMEVIGPSPFLPIVPFDPSYSGPYLDFKVRVETTGNYEFFARWAARNIDTDSFYVYILDPGGAPLLGSGPDFFAFHQSHGTWVLETWGIANSTVTGGVGHPDTANWTIDQSGDYTIRVAQRETETALDAFIFQTANLATPVGLGPPVSATVHEPSPLFSEFSLNQLDLEFGQEVTPNDSYRLVGNFVLGKESDGLDLVSEDAVITVGPKKVTLPAGTLSKLGNAYNWQGNLDGAQVAVCFQDRGAGAFGFDLRAVAIDLSGLCNPVVVQLLLGNDLGVTTNRLAGELHLPKPPDTTPPQIDVSSKPIVLWPPDGTYRRIQASDFVLSVADAEDKTVSLTDVVITQVTSDEPDDAVGSGDGKTVNDIVIGSTGQWVDLRSEREGRGNGRVYAIQVSAADASGNVGTAMVEVQVPHDQGSRSIKNAVVTTIALDAATVGTLLAGGGLSSIPVATILPAPVLASELQLDARGVFIRWQSADHQAYRVEYAEALTDSQWLPLGIDIMGNGTVVAVRVPTDLFPQRFYRVRLLEK